MNRVFKNINIYLPPKIYFFLRKNSKNWTYLTGINKFFRKIIWKFSNFMKPINPEKKPVNSLIWLRNLQWRRKEFFRGERSGHLKTIKRPRRESGGLRPPPDGSEVSFFKTIQSIWKLIHFSKISTFFFPKRSFF